MKKNLRICFKIDASVGMAIDKNGNESEAFVCVKAEDVKSYTIPSEEYKNIQEGFRNMLAAQIGCDISLLTPITLNEYLDNTEEYESEVEQ